MADSKPPLLDGAKRELAGLGDDLREMAELRWQLALLEFHAALAQVKRLAVVGGIAAVAGLTSLAVLVVYAADMLGGVWISRTAWLLTFGLSLLAISILSVWLAVRHFRHEFAFMEETLEELREDLVWLEEKGLAAR